VGTRIISLPPIGNYTLSVIVYNLNGIRPGIGPNETDAIPNIDSDAVLTFTITHKSFQAIARRYTELVQ